MGMHFRRLIYWGAEQNCSHFADDIFKYMSLSESFLFYFDNKSAFVQKMPRWQAITRNDDGLFIDADMRQQTSINDSTLIGIILQYLFQAMLWINHWTTLLILA